MDYSGHGSCQKLLGDAKTRPPPKKKTNLGERGYPLLMLK
jgi:hypothetical protein